MKIARIYVAVIVVIASVARIAHAEDKQKAKAAFHEALQHYNLGEFRAALDGFKEAYRNYQDPTFLFNLGQCERQLGEKQEAVNFYKAYLRELPEAPNRAEVHDLVLKLETQLQAEAATRQQPPTGAITPGQTSPPEPAVSLTGSTPAKTPAGTPLVKRWWLWTAVGAVAAVGLGVGLGVGLSQSGSTPTAATSEGTFHPF